MSLSLLIVVDDDDHTQLEVLFPCVNEISYSCMSVTHTHTDTTSCCWYLMISFYSFDVEISPLINCVFYIILYMFLYSRMKDIIDAMQDSKRMSRMVGESQTRKNEEEKVESHEDRQGSTSRVQMQGRTTQTPQSERASRTDTSLSFWVFSPRIIPRAFH
jgi:hypothetical protein